MNHDDGNDALWSAINRIEVSVKNSQDHIKRLFLHSTRHEIAIEALDAKVDKLDTKVQTLDKKVETLDMKVEAYQQENRERFDKIDERFDQQDQRFDKIEETLAIIVNHLKK